MTDKRRPSRKPMRMSGYDYNTNNRYFLTFCTGKRRCILSVIRPGDIFNPAILTLTETGVIVDKFIKSSENVPGILVDHYVIMPNHVHILLTLIQDEMVSAELNDGSSRAPTPTNSVIARYVSGLKRLVNREIGYNIWQRGYYDHIIRNEDDYRNTWLYISNNPACWAEDQYYIS